MIRSMTGFSEKNFHSKSLSVKINIRSLNHRFFDWNYRGHQIGGLENKFRATCQKKFNRGRIEAFLELEFLDPSRWVLRVNEKLLKKVISSIEKVSLQMGNNVIISLENLFKLPQIAELKRKNLSEVEEVFLEKCFEKVIDEVLEMRKREGREMAREIRLHLQNIRQMVRRIEKGARRQPLLIQERLSRKLKELSEEIPLSEDKLAEEAAYFAQRYDLKEEIARLKSHLKYAQQLLSQKEAEPVGKKLDFIAQELYREANTLNSKSQDIEIVRESLSIKAEVESIRQQAQNLE